MRYLPIAVLLIALSACGSAPVPGQHVQACVNAALGTSVEPPAIVRLTPVQFASRFGNDYDAIFERGTVYHKGRFTAELFVHELARNATWRTWARQPTEAEFAAAKRACARG